MLLQPENMKIPLQGHFGRHDTFFSVKVNDPGVHMILYIVIQNITLLAVIGTQCRSADVSIICQACCISQWCILHMFHAATDISDLSTLKVTSEFAH